MKYLLSVLIVILLSFSSLDGLAQNQQYKIDSLIILFKEAGRDWNIYAKEFIEIGEPAIPALVEVLEDKKLSQWTRRIAAMTLNDIHSPLYIEAALKIILDRNEDPILRNQVTNGLKGHNLTYAVNDLWQVYTEEANQSFRSNIAGILFTSDTAMAYQAYNEIYHANEGYIMQQALLNMVRLRPLESTSWFLKGIQTMDWMTANLSMDSLITNQHIFQDQLINLYNQPGTAEEVRWRITYVMGKREDLPESLPFLLQALKDTSWLVSNEAALGLIRMPAKKVMTGLKGHLKHDNPRVARDARWVIRRLK